MHWLGCLILVQCLPLGAADPPALEVLEVKLPSLAAVDELAERGYIIGHVSGLQVEVFATPEQREALEAAGYALTLLEVQRPGQKLAAGYHTYASLSAALGDYAGLYPDICRLVSLGQSVQGRELWALLITDNPDLEEEEPEFKFVSTMHGDEPVGTELCLFLIEHLLGNYGLDTRITTLVDSTAIWIVPLMNPDGLEAGTRVNASGIDLNRAFPYYPEEFTGTLFDGTAPALDGRPPEVARIMEWSLENSFVLAANLHTGSLVVNYPYDDGGVPSGQYAATPDDALFREIALTYAAQNTPMHNNPAFPQGVVNGSEWFRIRGGMQDWNYRYTGCLDVTIELSNTKAPAASQLPALWAQNQESMLRYIELTHVGIRGLVTDLHTGAPVFAKVEIEANPQPVFTDPDVGDYYRLLLPGVYTVTVSAEGYEPQTFEALEVEVGPATWLEVALVQEGAGQETPLPLSFPLVSGMMVLSAIGYWRWKRT